MRSPTPSELEEMQASVWQGLWESPRSPECDFTDKGITVRNEIEKKVAGEVRRGEKSGSERTWQHQRANSSLMKP